MAAHTTHDAWDRLAVADAIGDVFGFVPVQKTTKTACGKRVPMKKISREYTCPDCRAVREQEEREYAELQALAAELGVS